MNGPVKLELLAIKLGSELLGTCRLQITLVGAELPIQLV